MSTHPSSLGKPPLFGTKPEVNLYTKNLKSKADSLNFPLLMYFYYHKSSKLIVRAIFSNSKIHFPCYFWEHENLSTALFLCLPKVFWTGSFSSLAKTLLTPEHDAARKKTRKMKRLTYSSKAHLRISREML